jgi:sortase (surface protein transpeptidase)
MDRTSNKQIKIVLAIIILLQGVLLLIGLYYKLNPPIIETNEEVIEVEPVKGKEVSKVDRLIIPSIEVEFELSTNEGYLRFGGWVQNLNTNEFPLVIAAHRFGINYMNDNYNVHETLFNIDKLKIGDEAEIYWEGEKHVYKVKEIYQDSNNKPLKDSEVLLYTCEYWDSVERIFTVLELKTKE